MNTWSKLGAPPTVEPREEEAHLKMFIVVALGMIAAVHLYLWWRLVRDTTSPGRQRRIGTVVFVAGLVLAVTTLVAGDLVPARYGWLTLPGYLWLAMIFYLILLLVALEVPVLVVQQVARRRVPTRSAAAPVLSQAFASQAAASQTADAAPAGPPAPDATGGEPGPTAAQEPQRGAGSVHRVDRRLLLRRGAAITAGLAAAGVTGFGVHRAYSPARIKRLEVPLARLDPRADGLRVAVLADIHVGPLFGTGQVERMVEQVNGLDADVVTVVGDIVTAEPERVRDSLLPLTGMRARYGTYYVNGNHEYYVGHEDWAQVATELELRVLRNERLEITHRGGAVDLAGVNDVAGSEFGDPPDYAAALGDRDPSRPVLLMAHQPVAVRAAARYGVDLQLSGHTHGGQLYPFDYLVGLQQPVVAGLAEVDGTQVYVTNGVGFWGPPVRVGADPEITVLTLRAV